ncbi:Methylated-DNA--protein-cysteine methyltransferase [Candidatus Xenohaliotis californiensis]|uniref:Methylated-DNA--protein-cysteine methyltransferase n=1 Tax=Candidatus Xenohaliotis californiensis TaxID=84677 RepID=A0ABM9N9U2_9RICK|nr:Methylated-DNA--protein-cysteine methyltransferase [Candidatus Xenohaliotis californiensis]
MVRICYYLSPIGWLQIIANNNMLIKLTFIESAIKNIENKIENKDCFQKLCTKWLDNYFNGLLYSKPPNSMQIGTLFQNKVWKYLLKCKPGYTITYGKLAKNIGYAMAPRAVGNALGKNKLNIIIPCHRVIGANNNLGGYAAKKWRKKFLLKHESKFIYNKQDVNLLL